MPQTSQHGVLLLSGSQTHQENYARAFAADKRCKLIGLTDEQNVAPSRRVLNHKLAHELKIPHFDDLNAALERDDIQIACICVDSERCGEVAAKCARAGKHVYVDKPLASSVTAVRDLVAAAKEQGVCSQMFSMVRTPVGIRSRDVLASGHIGKLLALHCELTFAKGMAGTADLARPRREAAEATRFTFIDSKRELFCIGVYPLVLFQWLIGERIESVYGTTSNYFFAEHQQNDVEDFSCLMLQMSNNIDATITVGRTGWTSHPSHGVHQVHLVGTKGTATIDAYRPRLEIHSDASRRPLPSRHPEDPMGFWSSTQKAAGREKEKTDWRPIADAVQSDVSYFLDCIDAGRPSDVSAEVGAHAVEIILAAYRSAATGTVATI